MQSPLVPAKRATPQLKRKEGGYRRRPQSKEGQQALSRGPTGVWRI